MTDQEIEKIFIEFGWYWANYDASAYIPVARAILSRAIPEGHVVVPKEPYAIEYGSSNSDGTWSPKIARYPLPSYEKPVSERAVTLLYRAAPAPEGEAAPGHKGGES